jgi:hypothetical protein
MDSVNGSRFKQTWTLRLQAFHRVSSMDDFTLQCETPQGSLRPLLLASVPRGETWVRSINCQIHLWGTTTIIISLGGWAVGRLGGWAVRRLGGWAVGRLGGWAVGWLGGWAVGRLGGRAVGRVGGWAVGTNLTFIIQVALCVCVYVYECVCVRV